MSDKKVDFGAEELPLVAGFARAYRVWMRTPKFPDLRSLSQNSHLPWARGKNTARCLVPEYLHRQINEFRREADRGLIGRPVADSEIAKLKKKLYRFMDEEHVIPSLDEYCGHCGFYGMHTPQLLTERENAGYYFLMNGCVLGSFKATGRVVMGELGIRAQYAEPEALCACAGTDVRAVADAYNLPYYPSMEELVKDFPPTFAEEPTVEPTPVEPMPSIERVLSGPAWVTDLKTGHRAKVGIGKFRIQFREDYSKS